MSGGGAQLVQCNSLHGADKGVLGADAYVCWPSTCAACPWEPNPFLYDYNPSWHQYLNDISSESHVFTAIRSAWGLRWNVLSEFFHEQCGYLLEEQQSDQLSSQRSDVAAPQSLPSVLRRSNVQFCKQHLPARPQSCIGKISNPTKRTRHVSFADQIWIHIGLEDEMNMGTTTMHHETLVTWKDKPWSRKKNRTHVILCRWCHNFEPQMHFMMFHPDGPLTMPMLEKEA